MTDVTSNSTEESIASGLAAEGPDGLEDTVSAAAEPKTFADSTFASSTPAQGGGEAESRLRVTLETIRTKAEDLRVQTRDWTQGRSEQARGVIDERPMTAVAAAFGAGIVLGLILSR
jgi:ElaB/YqjD/DUF883 family membrane-anchored ribosome-binding protein